MGRGTKRKASWELDAATGTAPGLLGPRSGAKRRWYEIASLIQEGGFSPKGSQKEQERQNNKEKVKQDEMREEQEKTAKQEVEMDTHAADVYRTLSSSTIENDISEE